MKHDKKSAKHRKENLVRINGVTNMECGKVRLSPTKVFIVGSGLASEINAIFVQAQKGWSSRLKKTISMSVNSITITPYVYRVIASTILGRRGIKVRRGYLKNYAGFALSDFDRQSLNAVSAQTNAPVDFDFSH